MDKNQVEQLRGITRRPATPGEVAGQLCEELGISRRQLAARMGKTPSALNELIRERKSLTPDMAHRLGRVFGNGAAVWLSMQQNVDMWDALHADTHIYEGIETIRAEAA